MGYATWHILKWCDDPWEISVISFWNKENLIEIFSYFYFLDLPLLHYDLT